MLKSSRFEEEENYQESLKIDAILSFHPVVQHIWDISQISLTLPKKFNMNLKKKNFFCFHSEYFTYGLMTMRQTVSMLYIYIYMYREREREMQTCTYMT